jgi:3',5'-cyclic AMP phosphodiesterase CpdA
MTVTLAHLSDVHLAPICGFTPRYWNAKRCLGFLNWQRGRKHVHQRRIADQIAADVRAQRVDHVAVSGDLANLGLPAEFQQARDWLKALGSADQVSVVPGNHDIYTARMFGASCLTDWAPYMANDDFGRDRFANPSERFPFVRRLGPVALIGLNSATPTPPFFATGQLGADQIDRLSAVLDGLKHDGLMRVIMIHHPPLPGQAPRSKALKDSELLKSVLERHGAELVLHGHNHTDTLVTLTTNASGLMSKCMISGVPSASAGIAAHGSEPLARYHIYAFDGPRSITRVTRGLTSETGPITELSRQVIAAS